MGRSIETRRSLAVLTATIKDVVATDVPTKEVTVHRLFYDDGSQALLCRDGIDIQQTTLTEIGLFEV